MKIKKSIADLATPLHTILTMVLAVLAISSFRADKTKTIFMIGDSTMANKDISGDKQERGWGMMLQNYFDDGIIVDNHAVNGRSSKSFINEGRWKAVLDRIMPGDYLIIQFGHNDEKTDSARHTTPGTTFDANLRRFVREAREKGATPILMNSVVRRNFSDSKTAVADDDLRDNSSKQLAEGDTLIDTHGEYLVSPRRVAKEMGVVFVDANKITHDLEQSMGKEGSKKLHMIFKPEKLHRCQTEGKTTHTITSLAPTRLQDCSPTPFADKWPSWQNITYTMTFMCRKTAADNLTTSSLRWQALQKAGKSQSPCREENGKSLRP